MMAVCAVSQCEEGNKLVVILENKVNESYSELYKFIVPVNAAFDIQSPGKQGNRVTGTIEYREGKYFAINLRAKVLSSTWGLDKEIELDKTYTTNGVVMSGGAVFFNITVNKL